MTQNGVRRFRVVPGESSLDTEIRSSLHPIHGRASQLKGIVEGDFTDDGLPRLDLPHRAWVEIPVTAIRSGSRLNDMEMQRRAEIGRFPNITFEISRAWPLDGTGRYRAALHVTAHGRTRAVEGEFALRIDGRRLIATGQHTFDMRDFGVHPPRILALRVDPRIRVSLRLVAQQEDGA